MPKILLSIACLLLLGMTCAWAKDKPAEIQPYIQSEKPYGIGHLRRLFMTVYDAELWTDADSWSWDRVFALTLHYHMALDGSDLRDVSVEKIGDLFPLSDQQAATYNRQLTPLLPDVKKGDEITALYIPGAVTRFFLNGVQTGAIDDGQFARRFMSIWLDERTSEPDLRRALLGNG